MDRKEIIRILTNAIKGEIPFDEFKRLFQNNEEIRNMFSENTKIHSALDLSHFHNNYLEFFNSFDWESIFDRADIISYMSLFLFTLGFNIKPTDLYVKEVEKYINIIPKWVPDNALKYIEQECINKIKDKPFSEQSKIIKRFIKDNFVCRSCHPRWAQDGEWLFDATGQPLDFVGQKEDGDLVTYIFVNPKTGEEVQTQEFY